VMEYDLCPQVSVATIVDECRRCVQWLVRDGPAHGAAGPLVVGGSSAGGHLAAMMFATDWQSLGLDRSPLAGGLSLSGVHDLRPLVDFSFNSDFRLDEAEAWRMSPLAYRSRTQAPFVIACGTDETTEFVRQSQVLWDAWTDVRRPLDGPLFIPGGNHFTVQLDHADGGSDLAVATLALFR
jgi:arylformamidase